MSATKYMPLRSMLAIASLSIASNILAADIPTTTAPAAPAPTALKITTSGKEISFSEDQVKKIERIAHDYIVKNPSVLMEAAQALQKQAMGEEEKIYAENKVLAVKYKNEIFSPNHLAIGSANPQIIIGEFFGYQCPSCRATEESFDKLIQEDKNVKVMFIPWPFKGDADIYAAQMALASQKQGRFSDLHHAFMASTEHLTKDGIDKIAQNLKLNIAQLKQDMKSAAIDSELKGNFKLAQDLKLVGTPAIFVTNNKFTKISLIPGRASLDDLYKAIKEVR